MGEINHIKQFLHNSFKIFILYRCFMGFEIPLFKGDIVLNQRKYEDKPLHSTSFTLLNQVGNL